MEQASSYEAKVQADVNTRQFVNYKFTIGTANKAILHGILNNRSKEITSIRIPVDPMSCRHYKKQHHQLLFYEKKDEKQDTG
ncbi:unnamed protein product [Ceratitis capitata]|uniref:(Mediterranean fruit fly) hypothetical protein n=1 Tax=Ceratitis capitata TaxID=7213 RepID=A0A811VB18_CERCA|nr:unnamed protein product [Ceratitis capitata]